MGQRLRTMALVFVGACRPTGPSTTPEVVAVPDVVPSTPPRFLAVDADLDALHPLHVRVIRAGALRLERAGAPVNDASNRNASGEGRLIDADDLGTPSVPRILCESDGVRVAVYVERDDLAIVTARTVQVSTTPPREHVGSQLPPGMPGVRLRAGAIVRVEGGLDGDIARVRYERTGIRVVGFVRRDDVGIGYTPDDTAAAPLREDARLLVPTSFLSAPGGQPIAEIDPRFGLDTAPVATIGVERDGHIAVQYDNGELTLVGWVPTKSIERGPQSRTFTGSAEGATTQFSVQPKGTLLRGGPLRHAVGVLTREVAYPCVGDCDTEHPRLSVLACTDYVELVAD